MGSRGGGDRVSPLAGCLCSYSNESRGYQCR
uniref:Uncharacterized protein n=1 Tax=Arundo donax TaxID=35708 RepID=A0A0A9EKH2_ARUDO